MEMEVFTAEECTFYAAYSQRTKSSALLDNEFIDKLHLKLAFGRFSNGYDEVCDILELCKEIKVDFSTIFENRIPHNLINFSHCCLVENPRNFILITVHGGTNSYRENACKMYLNETRLLLDRDIEEEDEFEFFLYLLEEIVTDNLINFRSCQLLYLYVAASSKKASRPPREYDIALQIVWSSIPDRFLTCEEFIGCFRGVDDPRSMSKIMKAWDWYCSLVRDPDTQGKNPRSLRHLSRCVIRQRLKHNFQLPHGVEELDIPKTLKQYLRLRDYGVKKLDTPKTLNQHFGIPSFSHFDKFLNLCFYASIMLFFFVLISPPSFLQYLKYELM